VNCWVLLGTCTVTFVGVTETVMLVCAKLSGLPASSIVATIVTTQAILSSGNSPGRWAWIIGLAQNRRNGTASHFPFAVLSGRCTLRRVGKGHQGASRGRHSASRDENELLTKVIGFRELDNELARQDPVL